MKFYVLVVVICFGVSLVSSSEQHQNEHKHSKEKSHKSNHYRSQHHISNRHHQKAGVRHHNHGSHFSQHAYRANPISQHCSWVCQEEPPTTPTFGLQIIFNSSASLFSVVNEQSRTALIIEYKLNVIILLSGQAGTMTIFRLQTQQIITVPQIPEVSWISSKSSFQDYTKKLNIENLLQIAQQKGQIQGLDQLPNITIKLIEEQLSSLGLNFPFKDALKIIASFANQLSNGLSVLYQGAKIFNIPNNLKWLFNINSVLSELLKTNGFDLSNINIDSSQLFNGSGIQVLFNLFSQLASHVNLSNFFNNIVNSRDKTIQLLSNTSAGSHNGLDGLITILVNVAKFLSQQGSIGDIITAVAKYNSTSTDEPTFAQVINQGLEILKTQTKSFPNCEGAAQLIKFFEALNNNNLVFNNVNIFDILKVLFSPNPLDRVNTVIKVLSCFLPQRGIPAFFNFIKDVLNNTGDASVLTHLIPGLDISKFFGNGNPLQNIFQGQNASQLFSADNIAATLSNIPIFGQIAKQISSSSEGLTHSIPGLGNIGTAANSSQGGSADFGGIINSIQNGIGGLFGLGNGLFPSSLPLTTRSASASTVAEASSETSSTETGISGSSEASISAANPGVTSGSQQITDSSSITGGSSTEQSSTSAGGFGQLLQGLQNPFGLRGIIGGEVTGNLHIGDRKAHRGTRSKQTHGE